MSEYFDIFEDDKLNVKPYVIDFAHLIEQDIYLEGCNSKVYSISAEFGIGKTFFCEKLEKVLKKDNIKVAKLNIWELDFYDNPLMPLLAKLNELYSSEGESLPTKLINSIMGFTGKSFASLCEIGIRNVVGFETVDVFKDKFSSETLYDDFKIYQDSLNDLKQSLVKWSQGNQKPIVIIIDELDRCKPDYAVKTLEVLKHFFDIPGFVFVLAIDEEQLKNSVQCLFGAVNFDGYKRKFIQHTLLLPAPNRKLFTNYLFEKSGIRDVIEKIRKNDRELVFRVDIYNVFVCAHQYSHHGNLNLETKAKKFNQNENSENIIKRYFAAYSEFFGFTLRQMEQVFDKFFLFVKQLASDGELFSPDLAVFLICLHEFDVKLYKKIIINKLRVIHANNSNDKSLLKLVQETYQSDSVKFNRDVAPQLEFISGYSGQLTYSHGPNAVVNQVIFDNVDRFFIDVKDKIIVDAINTGNVNLGDVDDEQLKKKYTKCLDFISHFE